MNHTSELTITCPSCKITINLGSGQVRTICPYCGSFYNSLHHNNAENVSDSGERANSGSLATRLPPILAHRQGSSGRSRRRNDDHSGGSRFGRIITNGIGMVHASLTYLVMPRSEEHRSGESGQPSSLPPIEKSSASGSRNGNGRNRSKSGKKDNQSQSTSSDRLSHSLDTSTFKSEKRSSSEPGRRNSTHSVKSSFGTLASRVGSGTLVIKYPESTVTWQEIKDEIAKARSTKDYRKVKEFYESTFSSLVSINATFKMNPDQDGAHIDDPQLKLEFLNNTYDALTELPSHITKATLKSLISCLLALQNSKLLGKDETRGMFVLLQCPVFSNQTSYTVFGHLLRHISSFTSPDHKLLINWFRLLDSDRLRNIIRRLLQFVSIRQFLVAGSQSDTNKTKLWIPAATKVLALLNASNSMCRPQKVMYLEFYNSALDHIDLMSEYYSWQNPTRCNKFSYCQYPFILSIVAKKTILQKDSEQQMILNARRSLVSKMQQNQVPNVDIFFLNLNVRRSNIVSDSLNEIANKQSDLKKKLKVTFTGEPGLDMGGLTKEWFLLLLRQIFLPDYGMFVYHKKSRCYWFSTSQTGNMREYNLIGVLMGLAVYNSIILDLHFPSICYRKLLSPPVIPREVQSSTVGVCDPTLDDLSEIMPEVTTGLKDLLEYEGNVEEDLCLTFQASVEEFDVVKTHLLKPKGDKIYVTNDLRDEYVKLYMDLILNKAINEPFKAFYLGFHSVCASNALIMFRPEEVEMLVCGSPTVDMYELKKVTIYDGFNENDQVISDFWDIVCSFSTTLQKQFLMFTTGSDRVPVGGTGEMVFKISALSNRTDVLPVSHTCFNQLVLPRYPTKDVMRKKLVIAISNAEGFGLE